MSSSPPETGLMQVADEEAGVYLTRSDARVYGVALEEVLKLANNLETCRHEAAVLRGLLEVLRQKPSEKPLAERPALRRHSTNQ